MLSPAWIKIKRRRIRHVAAGVIGHDRDIVANFILVRVAFERIKRITHCHVRRPGKASIRAIGVKELRIGIVSSISAVIPDGIEPPIRGDGKCAEPVPFALVVLIVIDPHGRAEG